MVEEAAGRAVVLTQDDYYYDRSGLNLDEIARLNLDHPDAVDLALLLEHLKSLRSGQPVNKPTYCRKTHRRTLGALVTPRPILIVEGLFLFTHAGLVGEFNLKVFLELDEKKILERRLRRDTNEFSREPHDVTSRFHGSIWPGYKQHIEPTKSAADTVVTEEFNAMRLAQILLRQSKQPLR